MSFFHQKATTGWHREAASIDRINSAILSLPADDREIWLRAGMAIKAELGDTGFDAWNNWSQQAGNYNERDARDVWKSFKTGAINIGTLFYLAKQAGWTPDSDTPKLTRAETDQRKQARLEAEAKEQAEREAAHQAAKIKAAQQWRRSKPASADNWYLKKKHVLPYGLRCQGDVLVIPMVDERGELWNIQKIDQLRGKRFFPGALVPSLFHVIGEPTDTILVAEGYATGATVFEYSGHQTYIAFASWNLAAVAMIVRRLNPGNRVTLIADNDRHLTKNEGLLKATAAAQAIGGYVAVPEFPDGVTGKDFNDLHVWQITNKDVPHEN